MSEKGYWKARPEARVVYEARVRQERDKNFALLSGGVNFAAAMLGVIGFCIGNFDMMLTSMTLLILARLFK